MITLQDPDALRAAVADWRAAGCTIGFVPTMGALHEGHLSLVRQARDSCDRVVVSIFVNPTQFNQASDLDAYPRTPERDAELLAAAGCDLIFLPTEETVYPGGTAENTTWVVPEGAAEGLEGEFRPGHFRGVATVVLKLFNLVRPDLAVFGRKDAQQLAVIRQMVRDLFVPVEIVAGETVREKDGLALSSRNVRLGPEDRQPARVLSRALAAGGEAVAKEGPGGSADAVRAAMARVLDAEPRARVDYAEVVDAETFRPSERLSGELILPLAVWIGDVRLIDNVGVQLEVRSPKSEV